MQNHHGGVILHEGHLYGYSERRGWTCQELKTGKVVWASKKLDKGSLTYADGHFVCFGEKSGDVRPDRGDDEGLGREGPLLAAQDERPGAAGTQEIGATSGRTRSWRTGRCTCATRS